MDSVELWKYSSDKVISPPHISVRGELCVCIVWSSHRSTKTAIEPSRRTMCPFYCRTVRTKTWRVYPGDPRVSCRSPAKGKATPTVSRQTKGRGWTPRSTLTTSLCKFRLQCQWVAVFCFLLRCIATLWFSGRSDFKHPLSDLYAKLS